MENPRSTSPGSIMPNYAWLLSQKLDTSVVGDRLRALRKVGVPYTNEEIQNAPKSIEAQCKTIVGEPRHGFHHQRAGRSGDHRADRISATLGHRHQGGPPPPPMPSRRRKPEN